MMSYKTDQYGFEYYEWPSSEWVKIDSDYKFLSHMIDIHQDYEGYYKVKIGLKYILYSKLRDVYEVYEITEHTRDTQLLDFVKQGRLYLLYLP